MALSDSIKDLQKEIDNLKRKLGRTDFVIFKEKDLRTAQDIVKGLREDLREMDNELTYIHNAFKQSVDELSKQNEYLGQSKKAMRSISNIAQQLLQVKKGEIDMDERQISILKVKAQMRFDDLQQALRYGKLKDGERAEIQDALNKQKEFIRGANEVLDIQKEVNSTGGVKIFGGLEDIMKSIPGLRKFSGAFSAASKAAKDQARYNKLNFGTTKAMGKEEIKTHNIKLDSYKKMRVEGIGATAALKKAGLNAKQVKFGKLPSVKSMSALRAGFSILGATISKAFGPLAILIELVKAVFEADKGAGDLAKSMHMSYTEATMMRRELTQISAYNASNFVTTKGMQETLMHINSSLGTNVMASDEMLTTWTKLRKTSGLTNDELMGVAKLTLGTNKSLEKATGEILAQSQLTSAKMGVALNEKEILKEINKVSATTTLSYGKDVKLLAEAVTTAKALGMTLGQIDKISESILNFESSIKAELSAELLIGRNINLETARLAALNNDVATVAKEISKELGSSAEFSKMNRIQQEALAKALGMNREELAKTLFVQDQLHGLTSDEAKVRERRLNLLIKEKGLGEAQRILEEEGIENLENQASTQEEFAAAVEKMKEVFVAMAPALQTILGLITDVLSIVSLIMAPIIMLGDAFEWIGEKIGKIINLSTTLGKVMMGLASIAIIVAAYKVYSAISTALMATVYGGLAAPIVGGLAAAAVVTSGFGLLSGISFADDYEEESGVMGSTKPGYGKRKFYNEGELTLFNDNDQVGIKAGTNLTPKPQSWQDDSNLIAAIKEQNINPKPQLWQAPQQDNSSLIAAIKEQTNAIKNENANLLIATKDNKPEYNPFGELYT